MTKILDFMNPTRWIILGLLVLALIAAGWRVHHNIWTAGYDAAHAQYAAQAVAVDTKREAVAAPIIQKQIVIQTRIRTVTETITKEIPVYVKADACPLPGGFRVLHDAAASSEIPDPARIPDAATVPAQVATETLVANYGNCHAIAARLTGLQEWVRAQQNLTR